MDQGVKMLQKNASAGHKLGQLIGDWYEEYFVFPLLEQVGKSLGLYVDSRFVERNARDNKILWDDLDGNSVDYDFVLELNGSDNKIGIPVAFIECFWRRGSRHSKDKARDDSGKLTPMRDTYPTARFLGIVSAGDFTGPAKELILSRGIDLFYVSKEKVIEAFALCDLIIDYPDKLPENKKAEIVESFASNFKKEKKLAVQQELFRLVQKPILDSYIDRIKVALSAIPQELRFILRYDSSPIVFGTVEAATVFLKSPDFNMESPIESYLYQVTYCDGTEFEKEVYSLDELKILHQQIVFLNEHMNKLYERKKRI